VAVKSASTGDMGLGGHRWQALRRLVYATYGSVCYICEHSIPGGVDGGQVDHVIAVCERPDLAFILDNLRPIHGGKHRCPECGHRCNLGQVRQARPVEYARRKVQTPVPGFHPAPVQPSSPGRDWLAIEHDLLRLPDVPRQLI
jgi:hypothetical protein